MTNVEIIATLKSIVKAQKFGTRGRINAFFVATENSDYDADNFGQALSAGLLGHYWGRAWEAAGQSTDGLCAEYPALFIRFHDLAFSLGDDENCTSIEVGVIAPDVCEGCGKTREQVEGDIDFQIAASLKELATAIYYENVTIGGVAGNYWLTDAMAGHYNIPKQLTCGKINLKLRDGIIRKFTYGTKGLIVGSTFLTSCNCEYEPIDYDFGVTFPQVASGKCSSC